MQRKIFIIFALLYVMVQGAWAQVEIPDPTHFDDTWDGTTKTQPVYDASSGYVIIEKASELAYLNDHFTDDAGGGKYYYNQKYLLKANIDMGDAVSWIPLDRDQFRGFQGEFHGENHTIRIHIWGTDDNGQGFISDNCGIVQDLHLTGKIEVGNSRSVGAIAATNSGHIKNCWVSADVSSTHYSALNNARLGGIVGFNSSTQDDAEVGKIEYCCMTGNVSNSGNNTGVGGILGVQEQCNGIISHIMFYGTRINDNSQDNLWVGSLSAKATFENYHSTNDLGNDDALNNYLSSFSGNDLYRYALKHPYAVNVTTVGQGSVTVSAGGEDNILGARPPQEVMLTTPSGMNAEVTATDADGKNVTLFGNSGASGYTFIMQNRPVNVHVVFTVPDWPRQGRGTADDPYLITSAADWNEFALSVNAGTTHSGQYVKLTQNISIWMMAGASKDCSFQGTFDGDGHTMTFNPTNTNAVTAPFRYTKNATIKNLRTTGTITTAAMNAAGIVGDVTGSVNLTNCSSSVTISSSRADADFHGGLVASNNGSVTISGCVFDGSFVATVAHTNQYGTTFCGGLVGYCGENTSTTIINSLVAPTSVSEGMVSHTFVVTNNGAVLSIGNSYFVATTNLPTNQGQQAHTISAGDDVTISDIGEATTTYGSDGITVYENGIKYRDTFFVVSGKTVSLTLSHGDKMGYLFSQYAASAGTISAQTETSATLTMPAANITISAEWTKFIDGTGTADDPYVIDNADDWNTFANNVSNGNNYSGLYVKLTNDISVTTMAGGYQDDDNYQPFSGTFDGDGHTLTLNVNNQSRFAAPFKCVSDATIKNLRTAGTIDGTGNADGKLLAGLVGVSFGNTTITGCRSSVTLTTDFGEDAALAGLVAGTKGGSLTIAGCMFDGSMTGSSNTRCAGIAGYEYGGTTTSISNSLFIPATLTVSTTDDSYTKTFSRDPDATITNSFYTQPLGAAQGTVATASATAPPFLGALLHDYGFVKAYAAGLLMDGNYYYDARIITSESTTLTTGTYTVNGNVSVPSRIQINGNVAINIAEGATLHAPKGIEVNNVGNTLTINGPGTLTIDNCDSHKSGIGAEYVGTIIINSGTVNVHGGGGAAGIGGDYHNMNTDYHITINGGVVNAQGGIGAAGIGAGMGRGQTSESEYWGRCGIITINGGQVTAIGGEEGAGIGPGSRYKCGNTGTLVLGWTNLDDFVYCSTYYGDSESPDKATLSSITFAEGKQLMIEGTGVVSTTASVISGKKLVPFVSGQSALTGAGTQANPWRISSSADWMKFMLNVVNGNSYSGEYVQLDADIDISSGIGGKDNYPFSGTFLGNNHTLNVSLTGYYEGTAPFIYISGATIKNLKVTGYITSGEHYTSGLVGFADGTNLIEGCTVSATLDLHRDYASGFVGHGLTSATTIKDCLFDGQFVGSEFVDVWYENGVTSYSSPHYPNNIGVFWGWSIEGTPTLKNCMEKGTYTSIVSMHPMGLMGETGSIASPCYYVNPQIGSPSKACTHSGAYQVYTVDTTEGEMLRPLQLLDGITYYTPCVITNIDAYYQRTGSSVSVTPLVTASDGTPLTLGTNYTATLNGEAVTLYPMDFPALGTKVFTVTGLGNCKGSKSTSFIVSGFDGEGTADSPYIISSEDQWVAFASEVNHGNDCSGKYLKLTADISTSTRCGVVSGSTPEYAFSGTFDGNGHTITITVTDNENQGTALFHYINGATIRNLTTAGTIITNQSHSSGLVGFANGTNLIEGCTVTTTIDITCNYAAGFVGHGMSSVTTIRNCVFAGQFIGRNYYHNSGYGNPSYPAGFWGWGDNATVALENCVDIGTYNNVGSMHPMGHLGSNTTGTLTNCYYQNILPSNPLRGWTVTANSAFGKVGTSPSDTEIYKQITINSTTVYSLGCAYDISELYGINEPITPGLIEPLNGKALAFGTDYTVTLDGNSVAALPFSFSTMGSHTLEVSGTGNYSGSKSFTFSVVDIVLTGGGTEENPFCIGSADDWDTFVGFVNGGNSYRGKYVKLMDNISVTQKCGTVGSRAFSGTFLGNGKTISATISVDSDGTALFCYINDATIQNLKVTGSISSSQSYVSGLVGIAEGTNLIKDCAVTAQILNPSYYGTYAGGFVGRDNSRATTIEGCVFAGSITGYGRTQPGSYWGVSLNVSSAVVNCLDHGYYTGCKNFSGSFGIRINGSSQVYSITPDKGVSLANGRAAVAEYNVSGLTIYETGLKYNDVLYAAEGDAISLIIGSMSGYTTSDYTASGGTLTGTGNPYTLTMPASNVTINAAQCTPNTLPTDVNGTYVINSTNDWDIFCANVESGNSFSGETVKLMDDISVSTMAGSSETNSFQGTFLGDGHTITANITNNSGQGTAPFRYINGATIKDLKVAGTIASSQYHTSGLVGFANGTNTIEDCLVTATLNITSNYAGGIIGHGLTSATTIRGCVFAGTINGVDGDRNNIGGIWGWSNSGTPTLLNCLENGTYTNIASMHPMGLQGGSGTITNCFYVNPQVGEPSNACTVSGAKQAYTTATAPANLGSLVEDYGMVKSYKNCIWFDGNYYVKNTFVLTEDAGVTELIDYAGATDQLVSFTRSGLTANAYSTMCLPFSFSAPSACTFYAFTGIGWNSINKQWEATITQQVADATLNAHTPYIFKCTGTEATFTGTIATVAGSYGDTELSAGAVNATSGDDKAWTFKGTYAAISWANGNPDVPTYGFSTYVPVEQGNTQNIAAGTFVRFVKGASLAPFRARLIYSGDNSHLKGPVRGSGNDNDILPQYIVVRIINNNGTITTVGAIDTETGEITNDAWFTLEGKMLTGEPTESGIYIYKGQKVSISK